MSRIMAITSKIPMKERPAVYYGGRSGNLLWTQGNASVLHWFVEAAGGDYLPRAIDNNFAEVGMEKVLSWNPDCILVSGWGTKPDIVKSNPAWATMKAVKKGSVNFIPQGIFAWEYASGESVLLAIYMAKIFHPGLFRDWDMKREMMYFYSEVYGKKITLGDAALILKCLPPR
jgi:iron complex transport system substrate-binding protein